MLDKILHNIEGKAKEEAEKIFALKQGKILELEENFEKDFAEKKKAELLQLEQKTEKEIKEIKQELKLNNSFKLGRAKKEAATNVYQKAVDKVVFFDELKFNQIINKLFSKISIGHGEEITAGERTANVLRQIAKPGTIIAQGLNEEGFVVKTKAMDIDMRISQILDQNKETTDPKVAEILFS